MAEETTSTTTTTTNSGANNSMMLIIGAIVLAAILGYVVFSSANTDNNEMATETTAEETENTQPEDTTMMENNAVLEEQPVEEMPEVNTMELNLNDTGVGAELDTSTTNPNVKTFEIEAGSFFYRPNTITVNKGDTVRIIMNAVDMMHDFNIDELGVKMPVTQSGQTNTVEFTVTEAGTYEFYCSIGQHRQQGQVGTLIVQ